MRREFLGKEASKKRGAIDKLTTVRGIVIPVEWDKEGNALAVAISGADEQEYMIEHDEKGKELLKFIRHEIEVECEVRKLTKNRKTVTVKSYKLENELRQVGMIQGINY